MKLPWVSRPRTLMLCLEVQPFASGDHDGDRGDSFSMSLRASGASYPSSKRASDKRWTRKKRHGSRIQVWDSSGIPAKFKSSRSEKARTGQAPIAPIHLGGDMNVLPILLLGGTRDGARDGGVLLEERTAQSSARSGQAAPREGAWDSSGHAALSGRRTNGTQIHLTMRA